MRGEKNKLQIHPFGFKINVHFWRFIITAYTCHLGKLTNVPTGYPGILIYKKPQKYIYLSIFLSIYWLLIKSKIQIAYFYTTEQRINVLMELFYCSC